MKGINGSWFSNSHLYTPNEFCKSQKNSKPKPHVCKSKQELMENVSVKKVIIKTRVNGKCFCLKVMEY